MPQLKLTALAVPMLLAAAASPAVGANAIASTLVDDALPDLLIDQAFSQLVLQDGDAVARAYVYIDVANFGSGAAPGTVLQWTIRDATAHAANQAGQAAGFWATGTAQIPPLGVNDGTIILIEVTEYAGEMPTPGGFGRYFLHAVADVGDAADESDEANNEFTAQVWGGEATVQ